MHFYVCKNKIPNIDQAYKRALLSLSKKKIFYCVSHIACTLALVNSIFYLLYVDNIVPHFHIFPSIIKPVINDETCLLQGNRICVIDGEIFY